VNHPNLLADAFLRYGKGRYGGLNFGDCMAYAVAQSEEAPLLFAGDDFARTDVARWDG
jgi:ribonuclease VapC